MNLISATAAHIEVARGFSGASSRVLLDGNTRRQIASVNMVRGFAHITGTRGSAWESFSAVMLLDGGGEFNSICQRFAKGVKNGTDDRE